MNRQYPAVIHRDEGSDYGVSFPDFPGCVSAGSTIEQAVAEGMVALSLHVSGMAEDGEAFPDPTPADQVLKGAHREGFISLVMIPVNLPARAKRYNVMLPEDLVEQADLIAPNRSAYLTEALRAKLATDLAGNSHRGGALVLERQAHSGRVRSVKHPVRKSATNSAV
ncbi:type II toxin-antitoxin system HicB family antitoxin [Magnetospira sp. QH-2]|uniref:type II toxin-antitoxin system HicB family antitoxin n=1 Tax=Magnetospira sp. (strain QH-2) TaxID=1288970 RepID=UPI0003E814DD|nr:type II toxin-antitoxin system HicB family antitoxin [Magnetospira sp. QH-2]CCQ72363.1 conserved protein of unknown function [Magnetospira sp. QH-2]